MQNNVGKISLYTGYAYVNLPDWQSCITTSFEIEPKMNYL